MKISRAMGLAALSISLMVTSAGCSSLSKEMITAMNSNTDIHLSVEGDSSDVERGTLEWVELDQLTTHKQLRKVWDDKLNVIRFDTNNKNGPIYVDEFGDWAGNNTLYNAFQNKAFVKDFWSSSKLKSDLAQVAMSEYTDIKNESTGIIASVNAYYNILPDNADETSGLFNYLTRAEVMSAVYRGSNQVMWLEEDMDFSGAVGESPYNIYAQNVRQYNWFDTESGSLNESTYNSTMSRAEAIYLIMNTLFSDELAGMDGKGTGLSDCKNAGNVADKQKFTGGYAYKVFELEYCLQNRDKGVPQDLYNAMVLAHNKGIISSDTTWWKGITGGQLMTLLINAYDKAYDENNYLTNAKLGANAGEVLVYVEEEEEPEIIEETFETNVVVQKVKDIADIDALIRVYGDELNMTEEEIEEARKTAEGFTIEACDKYMLVDFCHFLNVRVGPGTEFRIKKSVPKDTKVHIVGIVHENGWYRVIADGKISYQCGAYFSDLEGADTSNMKFEYESSESDGADESNGSDGADGKNDDSIGNESETEASTATEESLF